MAKIQPRGPETGMNVYIPSDIPIVERLLLRVNGLLDIEAYKDEKRQVELELIFRGILRTLTEREEQVVILRYWGGKRLNEISKDIGLTKERVRQIEYKALRKMRHPSRFHPLKAYTKI